MSDTLEHLYEIFGSYSPEDLTCCDCCHDESYVQSLKETHLRSLSEEDFSLIFTARSIPVKESTHSSIFSPD